jgi:SOS-response transcriptional repressor LexA
MDFFDRVKDLTKKNTTLTLRAFIESLGLNYETYYSGKRRENLPRAGEAFEIAQALKTTVEYLVSGKEIGSFSQEIISIAQKIAGLDPKDMEEIMVLLEHKLKKSRKRSAKSGFPSGGLYTGEAKPAYGYEIKVYRPSEFDNNVASISYDIAYLPFFGQVAAGKPIEIDIPPSRVVPWPREKLKGDPSRYFTVKVKGDSMTEAGIMDGDYALFRFADAALHNRIMLVRHENESTIKRIKMKGDMEVYMCWEDGSKKEVRMDSSDYQVQGEYIAFLRGEESS